MALTDAGIYGSPTEPYIFPETGHTMSGIFRSYWESHGGLAQQGLALTETIAESDRPVQYFERSVFEHHAEYAGTVYEVLLRRLGADSAASAGLSGVGIPQVTDN